MVEMPNFNATSADASANGDASAMNVDSAAAAAKAGAKDAAKDAAKEGAKQAVGKKLKGIFKR